MSHKCPSLMHGRGRAMTAQVKWPSICQSLGWRETDMEGSWPLGSGVSRKGNGGGREARGLPGPLQRALDTH